MITNPLSQIHTAIWTHTEGHNDFNSLVRVGNKVRYDSGAPHDHPIKKHVAAADLPELRLYWEALLGTLPVSSCQSEWSFRFIWQLATGSYLESRSLEPITFMLLTCLSTLHEYLIDNVKWPSGVPCVHAVDFTDGQNGVTDIDLNRGITGWSSLLRFTVRTNFTLASFKDNYNG